jgi:hypothetical protein
LADPVITAVLTEGMAAVFGLSVIVGIHFQASVERALRTRMTTPTKTVQSVEMAAMVGSI